ncbi:lipid-transfer protein [Amycolatopsis acidicola]|uniref:Lipid-transfer protein n=1 Tax=Amycolatopsis acidicola TaxID=2596893 RepID=A0A5N0UYB1_9PSEU|nr:lipid-transfer protein [Amycolatopsis acidicola]KAA9156355.1 lipid-transfer protein [Amycolatopsis acidicola]
MREIAVVSFAQSRCLAANRRDDMADILAPVIAEAVAGAGLERGDVDFFCSGSHDFYEGRTFSYIESLDTVGAWPPISESHVEMDAAWAFHEAWTWLQVGHGDVALVYGIGRGSLAADLDQVMPAMLDPYYLTPLSPPRHALAGLQARALLDEGLVSEEAMAATVARSLAAAQGNQYAQRSGRHAAGDLLTAPYVASPLRELDISPVGDAAAVVVLAAGDRARELTDRPVWVRAVDHRMDTHYPGSRDLTRAGATKLAAERASGMAGFGTADVDVAELHTEYSYVEPLLAKTFGFGASTALNPSGGPLAGNPTTATGLIRIGEAAARIRDGGRALAHATSGPALQQNLVCLMEAA